MRFLSETEAADYLCEAVIEQAIDERHAIIYTGIAHGGDGHRFVLVNNCFGKTVLTESM